MRTCTILYHRQNAFGLSQDAAVIQKVLAAVGRFQKPRLVDPREPLLHVDMQIHLEVPVYGAIPWAHTNVLMVNSEHYALAWDAYLHAFDALLFRCAADMASFQARTSTTTPCYTLSWALADAKAWVSRTEPMRDFVCFLGGSDNKYEALRAMEWPSDAPPLTVYTTRSDFVGGLKGRGFDVRVEELSAEDHRRIAGSHVGHLVVSRAESFGYAAAEAEAVGAFTILSDMPIFREYYTEGVAFTDGSRVSLQKAIESFPHRFSVARQTSAQKRLPALVEQLQPLFAELEKLMVARKPKGVMHCPPILHLADCPPITVVTPTYGRKKLFEIAMHNMLMTDYPQDKIEWIVVEDCEVGAEAGGQPVGHLVGDLLVPFQLKVPKMAIKYIPVFGRLSIGQKRNHAIAEASHEIIVFMDDDDHYPATSFRRRVAWLTKSKKTIACCTTLALYDLTRGVSGVNVPPMELPLSQRISEATLTFRKSAWAERRFPDVSLAEGEGWIEGREDQVIEIPPQQMIVAFTHGSNQSSRRLPPSDQPPSCFWGFPHEYLVFIHGLVGVEVEKPQTR